MGNFSKDTFDKLKHYVGVRLQQGVPLVDADWNEQEDIRRYELQAFLKWFVGNGVPEGNDGFRILSHSRRSESDFIIKGGDDKGAGRCLVEGWDVVNEKDLGYIKQPLYDNDVLAEKWEVDPVKPLTTPGTDRTDTVFLDVWEREVDDEEDKNLVNPEIGVETCVRLKREWVVRVAEGASATELPTPSDGHVYYPLATLTRPRDEQAIDSKDITDLRRTGVNVTALADEIEDARGTISTLEDGIEDARGTISTLEDEIADARGIKGNLGNRLDESLTKGGQLRHNVVGILKAEIADARGIKGNLGNRLDESLTKGGQLRHNAVGNDQVKAGAVSIAKLSTIVLEIQEVAVWAATSPEVPFVLPINIEKADEHAFYLISVRYIPRGIMSVDFSMKFNWKRRVLFYRPPHSTFGQYNQILIENPNTFSITVSCKVYRLNER